VKGFQLQDRREFFDTLEFFADDVSGNFGSESQRKSHVARLIHA
jgi:hypothetical protein